MERSVCRLNEEDELWIDYRQRQAESYDELSRKLTRKNFKIHKLTETTVSNVEDRMNYRI